MTGGATVGLADVGLADIEAARERIAGRVRRTPQIAAAPLLNPPPMDALLLKLECLQVTGSFKARGATNKLLSLDRGQVSRGIVTASGGNHGLAVAYAARQAATRAVIFLPENSPPEKARKLEAWGAEVRIEGAVWDDSNRGALALAEDEGLAYFHPFADPAVIAGQGTAGLEMLDDAPELDTVLVSIGGGGLISGVATALKALKPEIEVIGIEPEGAPTLTESLAAGEPVTLPSVTTAAGTLAPRRSEAINLAIIGRNVDRIVLVSDEEMREAARWLWFELGVAAELSGAAALAALLTGRAGDLSGRRVAALICGAGTDGLSSGAA